MRDGIAVTKPNFVVTRASEIPLASSLFSGLEKLVICRKTSIMPVTVPNSPSRGAVAAVTAINGRAFSSLT